MLAFQTGVSLCESSGSVPLAAAMASVGVVGKPAPRVSLSESAAALLRKPASKSRTVAQLQKLVDRVPGVRALCKSLIESADPNDRAYAAKHLLGALDLRPRRGSATTIETAPRGRAAKGLSGMSDEDMVRFLRSGFRPS